MAQVIFKREMGDGLIYAAIWVADTKLQFVNDVAALDLVKGEPREIYWRIAGDGGATLKITRSTDGGPVKLIVEDAIPDGKIKWRDWGLFEA